MRHLIGAGLFLLASTAAAAELPHLPSNRLSVGPIDITLGFSSGLAGTAKGEYVSAIGQIDDSARFTPGYTLNLDAIGNTSSRKADNARLAGGLGLVSVDPKSFFPKLAGFIQVQAQTGQVNRQSGSGFDRVNQVVLGATVEFVPAVFTNFIMKGHQPTTPMSEDALRCATLTADQLKQDPECRQLIDEARRKQGAIEGPPMFVFGYFHPLRTSGGDIGDLPNGVEANKFTVELIADNHLPGIRLFGRPLHVTANLSGTYPATGADKRLEGKIDVGLGIDLTRRLKPLLKYVSGRKDGFTYNKSVIAGFLLDLAKLDLAKRHAK
jgi:hypothetical protein